MFLRSRAILCGHSRAQSRPSLSRTPRAVGGRAGLAGPSRALSHFVLNTHLKAHIIIASILWLRNGGPEELSNLPTLTQPGRGAAGTQVALAPEPDVYLLWFHSAVSLFRIGPAPLVAGILQLQVRGTLGVEGAPERDPRQSWGLRTLPTSLRLDQQTWASFLLSPSTGSPNSMPLGRPAVNDHGPTAFGVGQAGFARVLGAR